MFKQMLLKKLPINRPGGYDDDDYDDDDDDDDDYDDDDYDDDI